MLFAPRRLLVGTLAALLALWALGLAGCAAGLPQVPRTPTRALAAPADAALPAALRNAKLPADTSGVWPLLQASYALDARLALIAGATTSLDLQTYLIADDPTGRSLLRALRDAARRGVRVRLLVDDLYTNDLDHLLLGLAAVPNAEVRLFNPFVTARESSVRRLIALASDFKRLNHRMHNKLFIADGTFAVLGGRNLADEYFFRGASGNFIDFDLLLGGNVVTQLNGWFDLYWNSAQAYPIQAITAASGRAQETVDELTARFDDATQADRVGDPPAENDLFGAPPLRRSLQAGQVTLLPAPADAFADSPDKIDPANHSIAVDDTLTHRFLLEMSGARSEVELFSPYFIPGADALARIRRLRDEQVRITVLTNSLAVSDEPLVSIGLGRHQLELLKMGVELYELSSTRLKLDRTLRGLLGSSTGRLHAKLGIIDRRVVLVGSMNLDPRSATINTEIGVRVQSPELARMVLGGFRFDSPGDLDGGYRVMLRPDGRGVRWETREGNELEAVEVDPETSIWQRLRLMLLSWFIPENQL